MRRRVMVFAFFLLMTIGATCRCAQASNLVVNCDRRETISKTLKLLVAGGPSFTLETGFA